MAEVQRLPRRGYLGFSTDARPSAPEQLKEGAERWIVCLVNEPARSAGLLLGDDLLCIDGERVTSLAALRFFAGRTKPGATCRLQVLREGTHHELDVRVATMPLEELTRGRVELDEVSWLYDGHEYRLRAIWTWPEQGAKAAVWVLPSASIVSSESPLDLTDPTVRFVDYLTAHGVATLRVDRAGLGDSEGPAISSLDLEAELGMWTAARSHFWERTRGVRRALHGRSLGGMLAPLLAADQPFDAVSVWGTSSDPWHEAALESADYQWRLQGVSDTARKERVALLEEFQRLVYLEGCTPGEAWRRAPHLAMVGRDRFSEELVHDRPARFFHQLQQMKVSSVWPRVSAPVLAIHAEYDTIVSEPMVRRLVECAGPQATFRSLSNTDHFMHQRASLEEVVAEPWGGSFSEEAGRALCEYYLERASN